MTKTKKCNKCDRKKTIDNFYKVSKKLKYYRSICKQCALKEKIAWKKTPKGKTCEYNYRHGISGKETQRRYRKKWRTTHIEKRRLDRLITRTKRKRELGFIPINKKEIGTVAHHLDNNYVMYIPEDIHVSCNYPDRELHRLLVLNELYKKDILL